jgi:hypothetical protein
VSKVEPCPCPWCANAPTQHWNEWGDIYTVRCDRSGVTGHVISMHARLPRRAIANWNQLAEQVCKGKPPLTPPHGWTCPRCQTVHAPSVAACGRCRPKWNIPPDGPYADLPAALKFAERLTNCETMTLDESYIATVFDIVKGWRRQRELLMDVCRTHYSGPNRATIDHELGWIPYA